MFSLQPTRHISTLHECDIARSRMDVRFRGKNGRAADISGTTEFDPGCVKTHTVAKCIKNNSPGRHHASRVQYDLTLRYAIPSRSFYARSKGWSFYTANPKRS
jgi:hypothetical protein